MSLALSAPAVSSALVVTTPTPVPTGVRMADAADVLAAWLAGKDGKTVEAYHRDVAAFTAYLGQYTAAPYLEEAAPRTLDAFLAADAATAHAVAHGYRAALLEARAASATVNRRLTALRSVVKFARMVGRVTWTLELPGVEAAKYRDTRGPGAHGFRAMLGAVAEAAPARSARDAAVLRLLFDLALRRAEVVSLDRAHLDLDAGTLEVLGKKRRERERLTLPAPTRAALAAWCVVRGNAPGPLFTNFDRAAKNAAAGGRLTGRSVARLVAAAGAEAGLGAVRPHGLRHAAITHALDVVGGDVRRVARFSRHRDLRTLTVYDDNRQDLAGAVAALVAGVA